MSRNPSWTRDELILALDLYAKLSYNNLSFDHPEVVELSDLLNKLPIHSESVRQDKFRNASGVGMKLGNFAALDPSYSGKGLQAGSRLDREVWDEFWDDKNRLRETAMKISAHYAEFSTPRTEQERQEQWDDDEEFAEGRILTRIHKQRERNSSIVRKKKAQVLAETGKLACEVCGFDFEKVYGEIGRGFAECHHKVPVAKLTPKSKTKLADLAIVCANCHRMLHRSSLWYTLNDLKGVFSAHEQHT